MSSEAAGLAAYERVAASIRAAVASGELGPGSRLPGNRDLAQQHGVSLPTLQKAVALLQEEGWLVPRASVGVYVSDDPPKDRPAVTLSDLRRAVVELRTAVSVIEERLDRLEGESNG
ncbi:winged helix-turn-helix domain-containing protein [Amycolatopsis acidiphila]|uniref:Winged helix-turn-helix transcriptional regulator n=1 Tax=Amycolatopsis acidiphila TaxID=715473 RepID=A0A558A3S1_9PSEU|nr:winged helix-turn-helix domain-containing protein [Amycolatopsis acidiphila]TVT18905.1 winged helix-turn-helix transcriptional regulator [Amycolatopsis acidiphila]UIJ60603.1 winged helix-turn-helix domain-containing protein [Amycolatopsis acidiphila]